MVRLDTLALNENQFTGTLPSSWSTMTSMENLYLYTNQFSGTLPFEWSAMNRLTYLHLYLNELAGTLPSSWSSMTLLKHLYLYSNQLTGTLPSEWSTMVALEKLSLQNNELTGSLPSLWSSMTQLAELRLDNNQLNGSLPLQWSTLKQLTYLSISTNKLTGSLSWSWASLTLLANLYLHNNRLSGTLPQSWATMTSLSYLAVHNNSLNGPLPSEWSQMTSLVGLQLYDNLLTGSLPPSWANLTMLMSIYAQHNRLSGSLPSSWASMKSLRYLYLSNNSLEGTIPSEWSTIRLLALLYLDQNALTGTLPPSWGALTSLQDVWLDNNQLQGTLPTSWSNITFLRNVYLNGNRLNGPLPPSWSSIRYLSTLQLAGNSFSGPLPHEWGILTNVRYLYLGHNQLTGTLPPQWSGMQRLQVLDVSLNMLTGSLPLEWQQWTSMVAFHAAFNVLEGTVPMEWGWTAIDSFNVSYNRLQYPLPLWVQSAAQSCDRDCVDLKGNCFDTRQVSWAVGTGWNRTLLQSLVNPVRLQSGCQTTTATLSIPSATIEKTVSHNNATNTDTFMLSPSSSLPVVPPPAVVIGPTLGDSVAAAVVSGPLASAALGAAAASTIQRAMLAMRVVACTYSTSSGIVPVGFSDNPLQLVVPGCGPSSQDHCGAVIGNCLILLIVAILAVCYGFLRSALSKGKEQQKDGPQSIGEWIATAGFPGRMLLPFAIVVQPTVASIVWLLGYGHGNAESVVIALVGAIVFAVFIVVYFVRIWRLVARRHCIPTLLSIGIDDEALGCEMNVRQRVLHWARKMIQRRTLWIVHPGYIGFELVHYSYQLKGWAGGFAKYREGRHMYSAVGLGMSIVAGIAGGVSLSNTAACDAVRYILLLVAIASLLLVVLLHPFSSYLHQCCQATMEAIGLALAIATVLNDIEAVDIISRIQLGVGTAASILLMVTRYLDERWKKQKASCKEGAGERASVPPLQEGQREWLDIVLQCGPPHSTNGRMRRLQILIQFASDRAMLEAQEASSGIEPTWLSAE